MVGYLKFERWWFKYEDKKSSEWKEKELNEHSKQQVTRIQVRYQIAEDF